MFQGKTMQLISLDNLISTFFVMIAVILTLIIAVKSFRSYRGTKARLTLIIAVSSLFVSLAMIFLTLEKALLIETLPIFSPSLGLLFGTIAIVISGAAVLAFCIFAYEMAFPKRTKILAVLSAIPIIIYLFFWLNEATISPPPGPYEVIFVSKFGFGFEITPILIYFVITPLFSVPIIILFYYAIKTRKESALKSKRAGYLGLGGLFLAIAYIVEIIGVDPIPLPNIIIIVSCRSFFIFAGIFFYWALFKLKSKE